MHASMCKHRYEEVDLIIIISKYIYCRGSVVTTLLISQR